MERREFNSVALGGLGVLASALLSKNANAKVSNGTSVAKQAEYLYWLHEGDRRIAREFALQILSELDAVPFDVRRVSGIYQRSALH